MSKENDLLKSLAKELRMRLDKHLQSQVLIISQLNDEITKKDNTIQQLQSIKNNLHKENSHSRTKFEEALNVRQQQHYKLVVQLEDERLTLRRKQFELTGAENIEQPHNISVVSTSVLRSLIR